MQSAQRRLAWSLRLLCVLAAMALYAGNARAEERSGLAQQRFEAGLNAYDSKDFRRALEEFRGSYQLFASPNSRLYMARCLRELGELAEAVLQYNLTAREASDRARGDPRYEQTRDAAEREVATLRGQVGYIRLDVRPPQAVVNIGQRTVPGEARGLAVPMDAGEGVLEAHADGYSPARARVVVRAGETQSLKIVLDPLPQSGSRTPSPQRTRVWGTMTWVGVGIAGAGAASFATFYALSHDRFDSLEEACGGMACPHERKSDVDGGRTYQTLTNVSAAVAGAGVLLAGVAWTLNVTNDSKQAAVSLTPGALSFRTRF